MAKRDRDIEIIIKARDLLSEVLDDAQDKLDETGDRAEKMGKKTGKAGEIGKLGLFGLGQQAEDLGRSLGIPSQVGSQLGRTIEGLAATAGKFVMVLGGVGLAATAAVAIFNHFSEAARKKREELERSTQSLLSEVSALYQNRLETDRVREANERVLKAKRAQLVFDLKEKILLETEALVKQRAELDRGGGTWEKITRAVKARFSSGVSSEVVAAYEKETQKFREQEGAAVKTKAALLELYDAQLQALALPEDAEWTERGRAVSGYNALLAAQRYELEMLMQTYGLMDLVASPALSHMAGQEDVLARAAQFRSNVSTAANRAMESQLLKLVETHRFSVSEFGKAVAQSVKIELIGIAARAAVWAIFETAMGLATMFTNPAASAAHFASAAEFAAVSGATVAAAAAVNAISGPGAQQPGAGEPGGTPIQVESTPPSQEQAGPTYQISLTVVNPLSDKNWDEAIEQSLMPALERAAARNVQLSPNVVRS